jgi:uncharacterized membrane protein
MSVENAGKPPEEAFVWPSVKSLAPGAIGRWFRAGWADLTADPLISLFYGVVLAAMGHVLTTQVGGALRLALTTGFLLVGPFLAIGLYELSRRRAAGEPARLGPSLVAWRANFPAISFYAVALTLMLAVWIRVSVVVVALFFPAGSIDWTAPTVWIFGAAYAAAGGGLALFVFATTALSLPLLLERRDMDTIGAAIVSFTALRQNLGTMLCWGACIVGMTLAGFATWHLGLVIVLPLIGHMTWHAYRETVSPQG